MHTPMKRIVFILLTFAICQAVQAQANGERLHKELDRIEAQMRQSDTVGLREALRAISSSCESSTDWRIRFKYNQCLGSFEAAFRKDYASAIPYLRKAYDAYPTNVAANSDFMENADYLACSYLDQKQYDEVERIAAEALVRGASLNDSFPAAVDLFTVLAESYEQRGDTIMPPHFHRKSQELSILYTSQQYQPDSVERIYNRLILLYDAIDQERRFFSREHPGYLMLQNNYLNMIAYSGNISESIWLGEQILQTARDSLLDKEPWMIDTYFNLLYAYAGDDKMDRCEALLPDAKRCLASTAKHPLEKDGILYYFIATGLMDDIRYEQAITYFNLAVERMDKASLDELQKDIADRIAFCNEKKGFGKK